MCFHAIIFESNWESRALLLLGEVVETIWKCSGNSLLDLFQEYASETEAIKKTKGADNRNKNRNEK